VTSKFTFDIFEVTQSLGRAKHGDISVLIERLRGESELYNEERQFLADLIEGKRKLPENRPATLAIEVRNSEMIEAYLMERCIRITNNPAQRVAGDFGVSTTHLHRVHRQLRAEPKSYARLSRQADRRCEMYYRVMAVVDAVNRARREAIEQRWAERKARRSGSSGCASTDIKSGG